ncbi:aldehyde dehydrogenase [Nocardioides sp. Root1257]|uniref:phenylacetic acid degradation protein PaaN n=1 Tax=unclassified Nocardioides TaxID=2615069 RepID=UPI0006F2BA0D|nr:MULTISPECIES: phenylacetic acid degradation protein PaaN [unclassified Nocardioides]KQW47861.1 aldehyde dehydrogenase [Nocardioides sp. Root1257]KRC45113.1 aldehyde dehydrogenase [Nocardioides sp. Root224]
MNDVLFERHRERLDAAVAASASRGYFSAFGESVPPWSYPAEQSRAGTLAFRAWLDEDFPIAAPGTDGTVATERSPYGFDLGVRYPRVVDVDALLAPVPGARAWRDAGPDGRVGVCSEILDRLHARGFEIANAVRHTSGQPIAIAFSYSVASALDRSLEALAWSWREMTRIAPTTVWQSPAPGGSQVEKTYTVIPRGISLVVGGSAFPTWNSWPAIFASLVAGNRVVVQPHPSAVLPLAITVQICQEVLAEAGFDTDLVTLAVGGCGDRLHEQLAVRPEVRIIDFMGPAGFCEWLEERAGQAVLFTGCPGVNSVVIDSTPDFVGMCDNLALSIAACAGQMTTAPHNLLVPRAGIDTDQGPRSPREVADGIAASLDRLLHHDRGAIEVLGALASPAVLAFAEAAARKGEVLIPSRRIEHPSYVEAEVRTPVLVGLQVADADVYSGESLGAVCYLVETADTEESIALFYLMASRHGAVTAAVYSTSAEVVEEVREVALDVGVALSENLYGDVVVNSVSSFSDFHGAGTSPASSATILDAAYVSPRFRIVQSRRQV